MITTQFTSYNIYKNKLAHTKSILIQIIILLILSIIVVTPILWGVLTSFKPESEIAKYPPRFISFNWTSLNYKIIIEGGIIKSLLISVSYAVTTVIFDLIIGNMAAYVMSRHKFKGKKILFYAILAGIPLSSGSIALIIANYVYFSKLLMIDKWITLTLIYTGYHLPMTIWVLRGGMDHISTEIEEAAEIDGCSKPFILFSLIPQLNKPAMASASILAYIGVWNEFIVASVMINNADLRPIQQTIYNFMGFFGLEWGPLCAAASVSILLLLIVFTILGKQLISGLTQGSVKG